MSNKLIRQLFEARLKTWAAARVPALPVAWENVAFTPPASGAYLRAFVMPADSDSLDLQGVHTVRRGVWQVSIVTRGVVGTGLASTIEDELVALFPNNLQLTSGTFKVFVRTPMSAASVIQGDTEITVPVSCSYRADTV